jgi:hypothetical protein
LKRQPENQPSSEDSTGIIVRRGALKRYDALTRNTAELPVLVAWDRRQTDRRVSSETAPVEQRKTERRRSPPFTWEAADFVVLDLAAPESMPAASGQGDDAADASRVCNGEKRRASR